MNALEIYPKFNEQLALAKDLPMGFQSKFCLSLDALFFCENEAGCVRIEFQYKVKI